MAEVDGRGILPAWAWSWDDAVELTDVTGWAPMAENGFGSAIAFIAGPGWFGRRPSSDEGRTVRVVREHPDGSTESFEEPFSPKDREQIEEAANWYLADWGIPARPVGFDWFVRMPDASADPTAFERGLTGRMIDLAQLQGLPGTVVAAELFRGIQPAPPAAALPPAAG